VTVWDSGGSDTFDFSALPVNPTGYDLRIGQGQASSLRGLNLAESPLTMIAFGAVIENVVGSSSSDLIEGNSAPNRLTGMGGNDSLGGGGGADTAVFRGNYADYTLTRAPSGTTLKVRDKVPGRDGLDTVTNCESLEFADRTVRSAGIR
jgi:hypothetical protein